MGEDKRIGVFLCDCGESLSKVIDFPRIKPSLEKIPGVKFVGVTHDLCSPEGLERWQAEVRQQGILRAVIGGCSPQFQQRAWGDAAEKAGLDRALISLANIREQCAWIHPDPLEATFKAARRIAMAIGKAQFSETIQKESVSLHPEVLVIGGGVAGMEAAIELADLGHPVTILEKQEVLGGWLNQPHRLYPLDVKSEALLVEKRAAIEKRGQIQVMTRAKLLAVEGYWGNFQVQMMKDSSPFTRRFGAIILATGCETRFLKEKYGLELSSAVLTPLQFDRWLESSEPKPKAPKAVAFMLDISDEFSRISTLSALGSALEAKEKLQAEVYLFCRNLKLDSDGLERMYRELRNRGAIFFRVGDQSPEISLAEDRIQIRVRDLYSGQEPISLVCDLLVVDEKRIPSAEKTRPLIPGLALDRNGFYQPANIHLYPVASNRKGIFLAGTCRADLDLLGTLADGRAAAQAAHLGLAPGSIEVAKDRVLINEDKCVLCLTCIRTCPHKAMEVDPAKKAAKVVAHACQGCGICAGECPAKAIQLKGYTDLEIGAQLEFLKEAVL